MTNQVFTGVTPQTWANIKAAIKAKIGLDIVADKSTGPVDVRGVKLEWDYSGANLSVTVDSVSFGDKVVGQTETVVSGEIAGAIKAEIAGGQ